MSETAAAPAPKGHLPRQIPFIIGNEAGERFGFYGMRNILTKFLAAYLLISLPEAERAGAAKDVFHTFVMGVYFFPLLGGWVADRLWGRYRTILWLSLLYTFGYACLAASTHWKPGFYVGLFLIAFGSGGIKPCVSTFVGDQFDQSNKGMAKVVFDAFYFSINFGSLFASFFIPIILEGGTEAWRPRVAFGIPGVIMAVATLVFWLGRRMYVRVPPAPADPHSFLRIVRTALLSKGDGTRGRPGLALAAFGAVAALASLVLVPWLGFQSSHGKLPWQEVLAGICLALVFVIAFGGGGAWLQLDRAKRHHPDEDIEGARAVLRLMVIFGLVTPFWSLFDQKASTWILQGDAMQLPGFMKSASQMQALNPLLVMLLIPFNNLVLYPRLKKLGLEPTALRRMGLGIAFAGVAWVVIAFIQLRVDLLAASAGKLSVLWQAGPYFLLTFGEVLVSATGLEFAYSQAPGRMKSAVSSMWSLAVTVGNLWVLLVNLTVKSPTVTDAIKARGWGVTATQMFFFAGFAFLSAAAFALYALRYKVVDYYRKAAA